MRPALIAAAVVAAACGDGGDAGLPATVTLDTRMVRADFSEPVAGAMVVTHRVDYRYDGDGRLIGADRVAIAGGEERAAGGAALAYDARGRLIAVENTRVDGELIGGERLELGYDDRGNLIREEHYARVDDKRDVDWVLAAVFDNRYDGGDRLVERCGLAPVAGGGLVEITRARYDYDAGGALVRETDSYREGGAWLDDARYDLSYDGGALREVVTHHPRDGAWVASQRFTFAVDAGGALQSIAGDRRHEDAGAWRADETFAYGYGAGPDPDRVIQYAADGGELARVSYTHEAGPFVVPLAFTRTRIHGLTNPELIKFLFTVTR